MSDTDYDAMPAGIVETILSLTQPDTWPLFDDFLRRTVRVVADEWHRANHIRPGVKIDVRTLLRDLGNGTMRPEWQQLFAWNHRQIAVLIEKNRRAAVDTFDYVDSEMPQAMFTPDQMEVISKKRDEIMKLNGSILDLGVYKGSSTRQLAKIFPDRTIHGFDSFEGLPEDWAHVMKGAFGDMKGVLPAMPPNVQLYKGWFDDTLPKWFEENNERPISLLRVDCDIYSSTKTIFDTVGSLVQSGTWIVFDELIGYRGFRDHEVKAFDEFRKKTGIEFEYVAFGLTYALGYVK